MKQEIMSGRPLTPPPKRGFPRRGLNRYQLSFHFNNMQTFSYYGIIVMFFFLGAISQSFLNNFIFEVTKTPGGDCPTALHACMELHKVSGISGNDQRKSTVDVFNKDSVGLASTSRNSFDSQGGDTGYLPGAGRNWWFDNNNQDAFSIFNLDQLYPDFYHNHDHVGKDVQEAYVNSALAYCSALNGGKCSSVVEFGTASCYFTAEFIKRGVQTEGMDGARSALVNCIKRGIPASIIRRQDLRLPISLGKSFSMALCTEVAEHIEPPFSSQLVSNLVRHSDLVWFSFESDTAGNPNNHIHHNNEQPDIFWTNLFSFYGYSYILVSDATRAAAHTRAGYVFYNTKTITLPQGVQPHAILSVPF